MSTLKWWEKIFVFLAGLAVIATPAVVAFKPAAAPVVTAARSGIDAIVAAIPKPCADLGRAAECNALSADDVYESNGADGGLVACRCPAVTPR